MTPTLTGAMAARLGMRSLVFRTLAASLATNVLLGCALLLRTPPALTILVPPGAGTTEDGWAFTNDAPDSRYLERHALSLVSMLTNITPRTMEGSLARLLEHVAPESYGAMEKRLMREIASLKKDMASVAFYPSRTRTDANALSVTVFGERKLLIGSAVTSSDPVAYEARFRYAAGRLFLLSITELSNEERDKCFR